MGGLNLKIERINESIISTFFDLLVGWLEKCKYSPNDEW